MIIRRILGLIILLTALVIAAGSIYAAVVVGDTLANLGSSIRDNLALASESLDTARNTLQLSRDTFDDVNGGLGTAVQATANASRTIGDSQPMIDNVAIVTTQEVPEAVEGIQAALPNLIQVAGGIDSTLRTLSSIGIDRTINLPFGGSIPLQFDLGIDYAPEEPFDATLRDFQTSLDGLPESMRGLEDDLQQTSDNLGALATDLQAASDNLAVINGRVGEVLPLLDQYLTLADQLSVTVARVDADVLGIPTDAGLPAALASKRAPARAGEALAYLCEGSHCAAPVDSLPELARRLRPPVRRTRTLMPKFAVV